MLRRVLGAPRCSSLIHHRAFTTQEEKGKALIEDEKYFLGHGINVATQQRRALCLSQTPCVNPGSSLSAFFPGFVPVKGLQKTAAHTQQRRDGKSSKYDNQQNEMKSGQGLDSTGGTRLTQVWPRKPASIASGERGLRKGSGSPSSSAGRNHHTQGCQPAKRR